MEQSVRTTCPYCGVGCGVIAGVATDGTVTVQGDPEHPANFGKLCSKGAALGETLSLEGRLLHPEVEGSRSNWETALSYVAKRFNETIQRHGPDAVAFYVSGQLLTEDYYIANKLMKGFIGSANIDTNSRLCMASAVAGHRRAFGTDTVPCSYEDLERAKLIVITGSNLAWCHPVLYQRIVRAKKDNPDLMVVVIDPRRTATCDIADMHLAIQPGSDNALFTGLLVYLDEQDERNTPFVNSHTQGVDAALSVARRDMPDIETVASACGIEADKLKAFFRLFARTERVITLFSQGVNQWSFGTDKVNAIINCHLLTGRIGRLGAGPFSITGQPNAMGGREVGGLANQLAAHLDINSAEHRALAQKFWESPVVAGKEGLKAVDLFRAVEQGKVKALWIMATNPAVSMPDADRVRAALARCDFVVVSDCMRNTDTSAYANVLLPALTWGEKDGSVTNSERRISRQRTFLPAPGEARADWWILSQVAQRMGFRKYFDYSHPSCIFREHAALSGYENDGTRDFDISALAGITKEEYQSLKPIQWPVTFDSIDGTKRMFEDGRFFTKDHKARFIPVEYRQPATAPSEKFPLVLNTGRIRDQWHTMTRTGKSPRLSGHIYEPSVDLNADDAHAAGIEHGELVKVSSRWGEITVRARISESQQAGQVFIPMHWNDQFASKSYADALVNPATDPVSGQPEFKHTPVNVTSYRAKWHGFLLSRRELELKDVSYWSRAKGYGYWRYEIAGDDAPDDWAAAARLMLCSNAKQVEWIEYFDKSAQRYRAARLNAGELESCIFIGPDYRLPERDWLASLFAKASLDSNERQSLLTGRPASAQEDSGRMICACYQVGLKTIQQAIQQDGLLDVEAIGQKLRAGTNCGSCIPELRKLLTDQLQADTTRPTGVTDRAVMGN